MVIDAELGRGRRYRGRARLIEEFGFGYRVEFEDEDDVTHKIVIGPSEIVGEDDA